MKETQMADTPKTPEPEDEVKKAIDAANLAYHTGNTEAAKLFQDRANHMLDREVAKAAKSEKKEEKKDGS